MGPGDFHKLPLHFPHISFIDIGQRQWIICISGVSYHKVTIKSIVICQYIGSLCISTKWELWGTGYCHVTGFFHVYKKKKVVVVVGTYTSSCIVDCRTMTSAASGYGESTCAHVLIVKPEKKKESCNFRWSRTMMMANNGQ